MRKQQEDMENREDQVEKEEMQMIEKSRLENGINFQNPE
jgi:hypothetical protein